MFNATPSDVIIVGAGPSGLAVASRLARYPFNVVVLEQTASIGDVWAKHYEGLCLNTVARLSTLGGKPFPPEAGQWPGKADVVHYLQALANRVNATIKTGHTVNRITYDETRKSWLVSTNYGNYLAPQLVLATGSNQKPVFPDWVSHIAPYCRVLHSSQYGSPKLFSGQNVLVVGGGNSGAEIASRVAETANQVWLSLREAPLVLPKQIAGVGFTYLGVGLRHLPSALQVRVLRLIQRLCLGDHRAYGLPLPSVSYLRHGGKDRAPTFYPGFLASVCQGKVQVRGAIQSLVEGRLHVKTKINGSENEVIMPDSIICATGFTPQPAIDISYQGEDVLPKVLHYASQGRLNPLPGLHVLGFVSPLSGQFREINKQSKNVVANLGRQLKHQTAGRKLEKVGEGRGQVVG